MTDLTSRITEALDQAERLARAATPGPWVTPGPDTIGQWMIYGEEWCVAEANVVEHGLPNLGPPPDARQADANAAFIAANNPLAVLRSVAADRRVLERHAPKVRGSHVRLCAWCCEPSDAFPEVEWPCEEIRDLADRWAVDVTNEGNGS